MNDFDWIPCKTLAMSSLPRVGASIGEQVNAHKQIIPVVRVHSTRPIVM